LLCPWARACVARIEGRQQEFPLARARKEREIWVWRPQVVVKKGRAALIENQYAPFLKGHLILPGRAERKKVRPKKFDFRHSITCHDIFVVLNSKKSVLEPSVKWIPLNKIKQVAPASLVHKALEISKVIK